MNKKAQTKIICLVILLVFLISYFVIAEGVGNEGKEQKSDWVIWSRTVSTDTLKNTKTGEYQTTLYSGAMNRDDKSKRYENYAPFEDTINVSISKTGELKITDLVTEKECYILMDYVKTSPTSVAQAKIDINKSRGNWYFQTDAQTGVNSMNYKLNCSFNLTFSDDALKLGNELKIDFSQAKTEQNITTSYDSKTNKLTFEVEAGKTGDIIKIDPTITLQTADTENLDDSGVSEANPNTNYGTNTSFIYSVLGTTTEKYFYIKFNLSGLYSQNNYYNFSSAILSIYTHYSQDQKQNVYHVYNKTWNEEDLTWNNQPCGPNFTDSSQCNLTKTYQWTPPSSATAFVPYIVTPILTNETSTSSTSVNFIIMLDPSASGGDEAYTKEYTYSHYRPKLTITYTPYIDIVSPTPSQIFTQDVPTAYFNISTAVAMDDCFWSNNSGITNYSMTEVNNTYFYNDTAGDLLLDSSSHQVTFYCNQSSDGAWRTSDTIDFEIDPINITTCRNLNVEGRNYTLMNNLTTTGDCLVKSNAIANITLECNNYKISGDKGSSDEGIKLTYVNSLTDGLVILKNCEIQKFGNGLFSTMNFQAYNFTINDSINGVNIYDTSPHSPNIYDSNISGNTLDIRMTSVLMSGNGADNLTITNVSFLTESLLSSDDRLVRKWYFQPQINATSGVPLELANITIYNISNSIVYSGLTNSSGQITRQELIEYINNGGTKTYQSPYNITVSKTGFTTNSSIINLTKTTNLYYAVNLQPSLSLSIESPLPQIYPTNLSLNLNYSITNYTALDTCFYNVINSSDDYEIANTTITDCLNITFNISVDGVYVLNLYVNESGGIFAYDNVTFGVSMTSPAVVLDYPTANQFFNNGTNIYLNFTATKDDGLKTCELWINDSTGWNKNYTWIAPTNATMNYTSLNMSNGAYLWNVLCNDSSNHIGWGLNNLTFTIDTIFPNISITNIVTSSGSQTIIASNNISDKNLNSCKYSIYNSTNEIDGIYENISFTCNLNITATVSAYSTYNLTVYAKDYAGNENSTTRSFTTVASFPTSGGGGGGITNVTLVQVVALIKPLEDKKIYTNVERAILYLIINNFCKNNTIFGKCSREEGLLSQLTYGLKEMYDIEMNTETLKLWISQYENNKIENVYLDQSIVNKWKLIIAQVLVTGGEFMITPNNIDTLKFVISGNVVEQTIEANQVLDSCEVESGDYGFSCSVSDTKGKVYYNISEYFSFKTVSSRISFTSKSGKNDYLSVTFRIIQGTGFYIIGGILLFFGMIFGFRKQIKKVFKLKRNNK